MKSDLAALVLITGTKSRGGGRYNACRHCHVFGIYKDKFSKVIYKEINRKERIDQEFRKMVNMNFAKQKSQNLQMNRKSALLDLNYFDMVDDVEIDAMHCLLSGVTKKFLKKLFIDKSPIQIAPKKLKPVDTVFQETFKQFPCEFTRRGRPLEDITRCKAIEYKAFLLYQFLILYPYFEENAENQFLLLFCAARILSHWQFYLEFNNVADILLKTYVENCSKVFGEAHMDLMTHILIHLSSRAAKNESPIFDESSFEFENEIKTIKEMINPGPYVLQQVANRIEERENFLQKLERKRLKRPALNNANNSIHFKGFTLRTNENDSFFMTKSLKIYKYTDDC